MAAELIPAPCAALPHRLRLPEAGTTRGSALDEVRYGLGAHTLRGPLVLEAADWLLRRPDLEELSRLVERGGLRLVRVVSRNRRTVVAAAGLALEWEWGPGPAGEDSGPQDPTQADGSADPAAVDGLTIHRGTLRSGDHLQGEGTVLQLGDVNPGARISAGGHVLVWGRLRGSAHAGRDGDPGARIVALQLRPLQLRIADTVARGPQDSPPEGLAEEARLVDGAIRIDPASPTWPLSG